MAFIHSLNTTFGISIFEPVAEHLFIKGKDGTIHLFDLKTAKPHISNFNDFKRNMEII